jgi:hypothetical protein
VLLHTDVVAGLIAGLELPTRLRDVGVELEQLGLIAENPMDVPLGSHQSAQDQGADGHSNVTRRGLVTRARSDAPAGTINGTGLGPRFNLNVGSGRCSLVWMRPTWTLLRRNAIWIAVGGGSACASSLRFSIDE